jgi:hypothetical protein
MRLESGSAKWARRRMTRDPAVVVLAVAVALIIWVAGEDFGGIFAGSATDPNTGPLLILLAVAYWPARSRRQTGALVSSASVSRGDRG